MRLARIAVLGIAITLCTASAVEGQRGGRRGGGWWGGDHKARNVPYDGLFTFVRLRYTEEYTGFSRNPGWFHDYPTGEQNFTTILDELTLVRSSPGSNILMLDDPEIFRYPIAYLSEPGYWAMSDAEAKGLREYLLKGGFLIIDDFGGREFLMMEARLKQALPEGRLVRLEGSHPIFDSFFRIANIGTVAEITYRGFPEYWGIFEDNDPNKRLMVIANHNNDIGDYWEVSSTGFTLIELSNEAFKLGVNYVVYGLTR